MHVPPLAALLKLVEMTVPLGVAGHHLYVASANQKAGTGSRDTAASSKQQWRTACQVQQF